MNREDALRLAWQELDEVDATVHRIPPCADHEPVPIDITLPGSRLVRHICQTCGYEWSDYPS